MNKPAEVFLQGLQCTEDAIYIGRVNTSLVCPVTFFGELVGWSLTALSAQKGYIVPYFFWNVLTCP